MTRTRKTSGPPKRPTAPPHNLDAEKALIGAALYYRDAAETLTRDTRPEDYYRPAHRAIARAIVDLVEAGEPVDAIVVTAQLDGIDGVGSREVFEIMAEAGARTAATAYAAIVHDAATLRRTIEAADQARAYASRPGVDAHDAVARARAALDNVNNQNGSRAYSALEVVDFAVEADDDLEEPVLLTRTDGKALLYAGKMHAFTAEPSAGKSWIALAVCAEALQWGLRFCYIDFEDTYRGIRSRLRALGVDDWAGSKYVSVSGPMGPSELHDLNILLDQVDPALVVLDGVAEALARDGLDEDRNADVAEWIERVPRPIARRGATVLLLDHVVKSKELRGRGGRGAGHKLAGLDGCSYAVTVVESFSRERSGAVRLRIDKDRPGAVGPVGTDAALIRLKPSEGGRTFEVEVLDPAEADPRRRGVEEPTHVMEATSRLIEDEGPLRRTSLHTLLAPARKATVDRAIEFLMLHGHLIEQKQGRSKVYRLVKPYRGDDSGPPEPDPDDPGPPPPEEMF